nr:serine protease snake [Helicoverpa armigera]
MIIKLLLLCVCAALSTGQYEGETCTNEETGAYGVCKRLKECEPARKALTQTRKQPQLCSYVREDPVVCCVDNKPIEEEDHESECAPLEASRTQPKNGKKAHDMCVEYQKKYVYPCERSVSILASYSRSNNCHHKTDKLVVAGEDAERYEFPHMALLGYGPLEAIQYLCGGSIISEDYILTAAHCSASAAGKLSHVAIGILARKETSDPSKIYKVKEFIQHPGFASPKKYNDIALIRTEKTMELTHLTVPACLHTGEPVDASQVLAAGWGYLHDKGGLSENLQKAVLDKFPVEYCSVVYAEVRRLLTEGIDETTQYCYGDKGAPKPFQGKFESKDTCQGDSGGPIVIKDSKIHCMYTIVGVTSFGRYCGYADSPGLYTSVAPFLSWIEGIVWPN